ncbi:hypothetical protein M413DRAFT_11349 [Hebeloma cylindrosporum]|uniref:SET domain-containing protein n=1 Tax=Hebeloma cylindrosporum TaxID=76867 RepID=A0A0C3BX94_HEBCY|nr:hypothetical protein M413DRAFT_11349 [Hebeloma cylindrosporum h7]
MAKKKTKTKQSFNVQVPESHFWPAVEHGGIIPRGLEGAIGPNGILLRKLPSGKLANTSLPERYEKANLQYKEILSASDEPSPDRQRITSIPPKYFDRPDDPDRHTECLITGAAKNRLFSCPLFLKEPVPRPKPNTISIKESPTGGIGVFAERDIKYGELLIAERPLLMTGAFTKYKIRGGDWVHDYTYEDHVKIMWFEQEQQLELAFNRMDDDRKEAYMALANSHKEDGSGPLLGVQRTNGFGIDLNELTKNGGRGPSSEELIGEFGGMNLSEEQQANLKPQETLDIYSLVAKDASRMNHSCSPNAVLEFSLASFSLQFHANRDIKAGEEIFYSYTDIYVPAAERPKELEPYDFTCACTACSLATPESDKFRQTSARHMKILETLYQALKARDIEADNGMQMVRNNILPNLLEFRRKLREEGLGIMSGPYLSSTIMLHDLYTNLGMVDEPEMKSVLSDLSVWTMMKAGLLGRFLSQGNEIESAAAIAQDAATKI